MILKYVIATSTITKHTSMLEHNHKDKISH